METPVSEIARRLGDNAEAVCRRYLSNGRREGQYWLVGDARNAPGRSIYVRLTGSESGRAAGKWTDAASGEHGDLLDIIAAASGHASFRETLAEARRFLSLPAAADANPGKGRRRRSVSAGSVAAAERLWAASRPIASTCVARYLGRRHILNADGLEALRFHPRCFYRPSGDDARDCRRDWPAMIAAVTDESGRLAGVHRTWLDSDGCGKAPVAYSRRAMGNLLGFGVRFGRAAPAMAVGEGIETMLSIREALPLIPAIAGLSAAHMAAIAFPPALARLYVAREFDAAGAHAFAVLAERCSAAGIEIVALEPRHGDFNDDLRTIGCARLRSALGSQLVGIDRTLLAA